MPIDSRSRVEDILNVILGNLDPSVLQPPQSRVEDLLQKLNEMISDFDGKIPVHICTYDEYDHETLMPTIEDPEENAFYLVPAGESESSGDMYIEWIYTETNRWERFGSGGGTNLVSDVRIGGSTVVSQGIADIPNASNQRAGVVKIATDYGTKVDSDGLKIDPALSGTVKTGLNSNKPIVPSTQHTATFYGLAKAAGDSTQSLSANEVGTYTDAAKDKILSMLGVSDLIAISEGSTASKAYSVGEMFIFNGKLHEATDTIAIGDAIVSGINCDVVLLGDELTDLKSQITNLLSEPVTITTEPAIIADGYTNITADITAQDGDTGYVTGRNLIDAPDIGVGTSVYNPKNLYIPFTCYLGFTVSADFAQSSVQWVIYVCYKNGKKTYISYNTSSSAKKFAATKENPIVEMYFRSTNITAGTISNIRLTTEEGEAYEAYHGKTVELPAENVSLYSGKNVIWTNGVGTVETIDPDGRLNSIENDVSGLENDVSGLEINAYGATESAAISVTTGTQVTKDIDYAFKAGQRVSLLLSGSAGIITTEDTNFFVDVTNNVYLKPAKYNVPLEYTFPNNCNKIRCIIGSTRAIGSGIVTFSATILPVNTRLSSLESTTGIVVETVSEITTERDKFNLPSYYSESDYIQGKVARINTLAKAAVGNGDAFIYITDQHWPQNAHKSPNLINYIRRHTHINRVFNGGDTADGGSEDYCNLLREAWPGSIHHAVGNHEYDGNGDDSNLYYLMDMYNNDENGFAQQHYYYVDNAQAHIRYIVLNSEGDNGYSNDQLSWFTNTALNVQSGWGIIIFAHYMYTINWKTNTCGTGGNAANFVAAINDYAGNGEIIAVFQGHMHRDRITFTAENGVPVIFTTCDKYMRSSATIDGTTVYDIDVTRETGTITEQAFDVAIINRSTKTINLVRIGGLARDGIGNDPGDTVEERTVQWS